MPAANAAAEDDETPSTADVFAAIRAGRIQRVSPPYGLGQLLPLLFFLFFVHPLLRRVPRSRRRKRRDNERFRPASAGRRRVGTNTRPHRTARSRKAVA